MLYADHLTSPRAVILVKWDIIKEGKTRKEEGGKSLKTPSRHDREEMGVSGCFPGDMKFHKNHCAGIVCEKKRDSRRVVYRAM